MGTGTAFYMCQLYYLPQMEKGSTWKLLRFHFSLFLMPVFWFALSQVVVKDWVHVVLIFVILHVLVYPASNGYNSYMDRDQGSIGGLKNPPQPTRELFYVTGFMDLIAIGLGLFMGWYFSVGICAYIIASRAYSYKGIRLKKYPIIGYLTVIICQGALVFYLVFEGSHTQYVREFPLVAMLASSLLIGGFYPLTQIYQHEADRQDQVMTISSLLGYRGTFLFCGAVYLLAFATLWYYFYASLEIKDFIWWATCMVPVFVYFLNWARKVWRDSRKADFTHTMRMNVIASSFANLSFIVILLMES
jgi:1,4-dihydroxy-2-naphthoate octaprenyltransferase